LEPQSMHDLGKTICAPPHTFSAKVGSWTQKNCSNFVHGYLAMVQSNFFAFNLLFLVPKVWGWKQINLPWPHFEFLSFVHKVLGMLKINLFLVLVSYSWRRK
jgi:hypothetical protein